MSGTQSETLVPYTRVTPSALMLANMTTNLTHINIFPIVPRTIRDCAKVRMFMKHIPYDSPHNLSWQRQQSSPCRNTNIRVAIHRIPYGAGNHDRSHHKQVQTSPSCTKFTVKAHRVQLSQPYKRITSSHILSYVITRHGRQQ